jgi:D-alanyl-lipoteichoic acid acyltransferase DltB (MBOAT superfamily)
MLFNSYPYTLAFLPLALLGFHLLRRAGQQRAAFGFLVVMSLAFYGWWNPIYLLLLVPMMLANYALAAAMLRRNGGGGAKALLALGIAGNLAALAYFKYANFFVGNANALFGLDLFLAQVVLPLGISFFVFQKIAFLVDVHAGRVERLNLLDFSLFVTFFPQLIAGPIVHHSEMMPQFHQRRGVPWPYLAMGLTIFAIGLAKKVLLADTVAQYATPQFDAAAAGAALGFVAAWSGALAYTAQLYFDFSGYTDMAIGAGLLFGIRLPLNFDSPYKATSIIDFWRRWHITLSRFLRDYLYFPLGGNRKGPVRRHANLFLVMLLGGFWHGAGWTFVVWGALHGSYLAINHGWRALRERLGFAPGSGGRAGRLAAGAITFLAVVVAWVFFRAADVTTAVEMLKAMAGLTGLGSAGGAVDAQLGLLLAAALLVLAWLAPNTQQLTGYLGPEHEPKPDSVFMKPPRWGWIASLRGAAVAGTLFGIGLISLSRVSEFLYFQF